MIQRDYLISTGEIKIQVRFSSYDSERVYARIVVQNGTENDVMYAGRNLVIRKKTGNIPAYSDSVVSKSIDHGIFLLPHERREYQA